MIFNAMLVCVALGRRQAASHENLDLAFPGSNPGAPTILTKGDVLLRAFFMFWARKVFAGAGTFCSLVGFC